MLKIGIQFLVTKSGVLLLQYKRSNIAMVTINLCNEDFQHSGKSVRLLNASSFLLIFFEFY